ncbi:MAG: ADP-forming succinate--CoA ligase subunit beta [Chloroflexi bacterium]|nr:ADP-forming succinate--CoA ligase subunit beta [Chloroflexota bacterium]MCH2523289.1 ADP-forming succinate--CoA ligase subunit beta [Dehalococcoidia bacterium]|tara:strand:- start:7370 stop:8533 length:1164 start_codon:yes stop_codon:yes gene_type:complete
MKLHEFQAKELLSQYGIPIPQGKVASTPDEVVDITNELGGKVVIKAQAHTGGRGKGGGVKIANNADEARQSATEIIGMQLITHQTGPEGLPVHSVLVEEQIEIERELYLSIAIDNASGMPIVIASASGGMDIEEVAENDPAAIQNELVHPECGFQPFQGRTIAFKTGLDGDLLRPATELISNLVTAFEDNDGTIAEINPLVVTKDGQLIAADAKFSTDDNADFRQKELIENRDTSQEDPREVEARDAGIDNYVKLDGNIGCLVNGAGLAMATMDAIKFEGGDPANFLDIGTANSADAVIAALKIISEDPDVEAVLVNIFGGLARTDIIADGVVQAKKIGLLKQPTVIRLAGTNVEEGLQILEDSGLDLIRADGFAEAAQKAVKAVEN